MKKKILALLLALTMVLALAACGSSPGSPGNSGDSGNPGNSGTSGNASSGTSGDTSGNGSSDAASDFDEITLNWGITPAPTSGDAESANRLAGLINEYTDGKVKVEVFPGATLGGEDVTLENLLSGTADMGNVSPNVVATVAPEMNALCLPFLYNNFDVAKSVLGDPEYTDKINEILNPYGLKYLGISYIAPRVITTNDEIHVPSDCKGQVIRVMGGQIFSDIYANWNLNTTIISWGECYTAMQQHTVDGIDGGNEPSMDMAFYEVAKYNVQLDHVYHAQMILMSMEKYNSLSEATRNALDTAAAENLTWAVQFAYDHWVDDSAEVQAEPYNMTNIYLSAEERQAWVDASQPVYEKYAPIIGDDFYNWLTGFAAEKNAQYS